MSDRTAVLIVGSGPVGLTLGAELARRDVAVRLVDRAQRPQPHAKAVALWPRAIEAMERFGAAEEIVERGVVLRALTYYSRGRQVAQIRYGRLHGTKYRYPISLPQQDTEAILRRAFTRFGGHIEFGVELRGLSQYDGGVEAALATGDTLASVRVPWLVGCDGAHSTVREQIGVQFEGAAYPQTFVLADGACDTPLAHDEVHYFMTDSGVLVVVGLPDGLYRVFASVAPGVDVEDARQTVQQAADLRCPVPLRLVGEQRVGTFRVHRRMADRFRGGRVLLAGDAAHIHSPAGGQGLNTGIEDAHSLAWRLAHVHHQKCSADELDRWAAERRHVASTVVNDTDRQTRMWLLRGWQRTVRDAVLRVSSGTGVLNRVMAPRMAQLALAYPNDEPLVGRLRAGMRLPNLPVGADGARWLHDLLHPGVPVLLAFAADGRHPARLAELLPVVAGVAGPGERSGDLHAVVVSARPAPAGDVLADPGGAAHAELDITRPSIYLIRPDGVIALACLPGDPRLAPRLDALAGRAAQVTGP
jgi:2-polyprenyl-6-methoxyphenol hydroxylase-like FAD-dependent oxidoreductase